MILSQYLQPQRNAPNLHSVKQVGIKRLLKQEDRSLNRQFEDFAGFYGFKPVLCRPYRGQTKGKVKQTVSYVRDNFMVGIKYNSLDNLNGQAIAWCNKVNGKIHATTNEIPFERLKRESLKPLRREYIIDKINLRRVQKDCLMKKELGGFDFSFQLSIDKRQIDELATMRFLENGENVVFLGPPGVGKTRLATSPALVAAGHRRSTYYYLGNE